MIHSCMISYPNLLCDSSDADMQSTFSSVSAENTRAPEEEEDDEEGEKGNHTMMTAAG